MISHQPRKGDLAVGAEDGGDDLSPCCDLLPVTGDVIGPKTRQSLGQIIKDPGKILDDWR